MNARTRTQAIKALDGMAVIVRAERLARGTYVSQEVVDPSRVGSLCRGRNYCAIGALWIGAGVKPIVKPDGEVRLPAQYDYERAPFLHSRPGLRAAYDAVNAAARRYMKRNGIDLDADGETFDADIEALFEGRLDVGRVELLRIIASAKRSLKAAA